MSQEKKSMLNPVSGQKPFLKQETDIIQSEKRKISKEDQERLNNKLLNASSMGNDAEVERLIKMGADITAKIGGITSLQHAAFKGHTNTCAFLIAKCAEAGGDVKKFIEEKGSGEWVALHAAARKGHIETCAILLAKYAEAGGDVKKLIEEKDEENDATALCVAVKKDDMEICIFLLAKYAEAGGDVKKIIEDMNRDKKLIMTNPKLKTAKFLRTIKPIANVMDKETLAFMADFEKCISSK